MKLDHAQLGQGRGNALAWENWRRFAQAPLGWRGLVCCFGALLLGLVNSFAVEWKFPCPENEIESYTAYHIRQPVKIDGKLDESCWRQAPTSPRFKDIV